MQWIAVAACIGVATGLAACGKSLIEELCEDTVSSIGCGGAEQSPEKFAEGVSLCMDRHDDAKALDTACAEAHVAVLECLGRDSNCNDINEWRLDKCGEEVDTPCATESAAFCEACPGLWFAPE